MIQSLLMFPLESELMHFCASLEAKEISFKKEKNYYSISAWNAFAAIGGHGKTQFGIQTQFYLNQFQEVVQLFCLGAAGEPDPDIKVFDVVLGKKTLEHD